MAKLLDGNTISKQIKSEVKAEIQRLGIVPGLAVIIAGHDPASRIYVDSKKKDAAFCGIKSEEFTLKGDEGDDKLLSIINQLNNREDIHGILVQLPLPSIFSSQKLVQAINPKKDVDAFHFENIGRVFAGEDGFVPCTPAGVMEMLKYNNIEIEGKHCVVVGRSNIVGKPQAMLMLAKNATVTIAHSRTKNLAEITRNADILIAAVGKIGLITADMVKHNAVVVDVAINRLPNGKICGDVDFKSVEELASYISPVPGGVGPMTRAMLMKNTLTAAKGLLNIK